MDSPRRPRGEPHRRRRRSTPTALPRWHARAAGIVLRHRERLRRTAPGTRIPGRPAPSSPHRGPRHQPTPRPSTTSENRHPKVVVTEGAIDALSAAAAGYRAVAVLSDLRRRPSPPPSPSSTPLVIAFRRRRRRTLVPIDSASPCAPPVVLEAALNDAMRRPILGHSVASPSGDRNTRQQGSASADDQAPCGTSESILDRTDTSDTSEQRGHDHRRVRHPWPSKAVRRIVLEGHVEMTHRQVRSDLTDHAEPNRRPGALATRANVRSVTRMRNAPNGRHCGAANARPRGAPGDEPTALPAAVSPNMSGPPIATTRRHT